MIGLGVAEQLSYLRPNEQNEINEIIRPKAPTPKRRAIKLREELFTKCFSDGETTEEIEDTIARAVELLRSQSPS